MLTHPSELGGRAIMRSGIHPRLFLLLTRACALLALIFTARAAAASITITKVVDTTMLMPEGPGEFTSVPGSYPLPLWLGFDQGVAAFVGNHQEWTWSGVYLWQNDSLSMLIDHASSMPGAPDCPGVPQKMSFICADTSGSSVAHLSVSGNDGCPYHEAIFVTSMDTGEPTEVVNWTSFGDATWLSCPSIDGDDVAFFAIGAVDDPVGMIIARVDGALVGIADAETPIPGGTGTFADFGYSLGLDPRTPRRMRSGTVAFYGRNASGEQAGIFVKRQGLPLAPIVDRSSAVAGRNSTLDYIAPYFDFDGTSVVVHAATTTGAAGIYVADGPALARTVIDNTMSEPGTGANCLCGLGAVHSGRVVALCSCTEGGRLITDIGGSLETVIATGQSLDGKTVASFDLAEGSLRGNQFLFHAAFTNGSEGVFMATVSGGPSPGIACDDGIDNDGDGYADFFADPGCRSASATLENPACQDGVDNDGDGLIDFDGGVSAGVASPTTPDPFCNNTPWKAREKRVCGVVGVELILVLPPLMRARVRRRRVRGAISTA